jgi:carbamoyltransferase
MKILGISVAHDSSACLYEDGKIVKFYKEERLTGKKRDNNPIRSIKTILDGVDNIDVVAYCAPEHNLEATEQYAGIIRKLTNVNDVIDFSENHHLQHASLAFYNSGFEEAAVIIIDRNGSIYFNGARESETIFHASYPHSFKEIYKNLWVFNNEAHVNAAEYRKNHPETEINVNSMYGIVKVYESATSLIKQPVLENGKTMGLSAYGCNDSKLPDLFVNDTNIPNDFYFGHEFNDNENYESVYLNLTHLKNKSFTKNNVSIYADYALHVQQQTQKAVCYLIQKAINNTGCTNIVISGGYGLNVVANSHYVDKFPHAKFYFEPLADDSGNSIGGAMLAYRILTKDTTVRKIQHTFYHGQPYDLSNISGDTANVDDIVNKLLDKKSVAVYKGLAESGPRALGNRSILFDPRVPNAIEIVNKIKNREWYRPFACMILKSDIDLYFNMMGIEENKFMTMSFVATELGKKTIPGVLHVDNTCRIQTIDDSDGVIYDLLVSFKQATGVGALLNTSFNLAGKPLVETPEDAVFTLNSSSLDVVWFPEINRIIKKHE